MKNKFIQITTLLLCSFATISCGGGGSSTSQTTSTPSHQHSYDTNNIVWAWSKSSIGFSATATLTCKTCESSVQGHSLVLDGEVSAFNEIEPTCTTPGNRKYKAEITYEQKTYSNINPDYNKVLDPLGHQMEHTHDEKMHYYRCTRSGCEYIESSDYHDFSEWEIIKEPDYGVTGLKTHYCEDEYCGYEEEEIIPGLIPTVQQVQDEVDKANEDLCPLTGNRIKRARQMYNVLSDTDKELIDDYEKLDEQEELYDSNYDVVSDSVSRGSQVPEGYSLELITEKDVDPEYGNIEKAVAFNTNYQWVSFGFIDETVDVTNYIKLSFYLYNPTASQMTIISADDGWKHRAVDQTVPANSWGEISIDMEIFNQELPNKNLKYYFIGIYDYQGYEAGETDIIKFSSLFGKKPSSYDAKEVIALINSIKNDGSRIDAYNIFKAEEAYNALDEKVKPFVTNYDVLVEAKTKASYGVASGLNLSELQFTSGWGTTVSLDTEEDETYGHVIKVTGSSTGGCTEFNFKKMDTTEFLSICFSVYLETATINSKFALSKSNWWTDAFDFSDNTWKQNGDHIQFILSSGWNEISMPVEDFNEASYFTAYFPSGEIDLIITPFYGKTEQCEINNVIKLINKIPSDVSSLQMKDTYDIAVAKKAYDLLPPSSQTRVTNAEHLADAIANCQYSMASFSDSSTYVMTPGWGADATVSSKVDKDKGHVTSLILTLDQDGALEYKFNKEDLTKGEGTVYFSIYTTHDSKFTLSKQDWWREAYDFSDSTWKLNGGKVDYVLSPGWNDLSMPLNDFIEVNYLSFSLDGPVLGDEFMVSAFYLK